MSLQRLNPSGVAAPVGAYSQGIVTPETGRWLHISGQIGVRPDGSLAQGFEAQAEVAWQNIMGLLAAADMGPQDLVKITSFLTDAAQLPLFGPIRTRFLGEARPASTLLVVAALARPDWLVEVEAVAWRA